VCIFLKIIFFSTLEHLKTLFYFSEWDTQTKNELFPHSDHSVIDVVIHEKYYKGGLHNDVALLFLKDSIPLAEHINTICLPPQGQVFDGKRCFVSGN
jgi:hypothetical protein